MGKQGGIHQVVAGFRRNDAISNLAVHMQGIIRGWGRASEIGCEMQRVDPYMRGKATDLAALAAKVGPDDVAILHFSIGCAANEIFARMPCRKVMLYHNITPAHYFERLNPSTAAMLDNGRRQLAQFANVAEVNLGDSDFNCSELAGMGFRDPRTLHLISDLGLVTSPGARDYRDRLQDGMTNILFVGRVAPNKRYDEILKVFHYFQHGIEPASRLVLAGSYYGMEVYRTMLCGAASTMELRNVMFTDAISQPSLNACYQSAHAFLCMSEHEGFCVPLLEAMANRVPVVAVESTAVPETMAGAGVLFKERNHALIAEMLGRVIRDRELRASVLAGQDARIAAYKSRNFSAELESALAPVL